MIPLIRKRRMIGKTENIKVVLSCCLTIIRRRSSRMTAAKGMRMEIDARFRMILFHC